MDADAGSHHINAVPETHVMNEVSKGKGQPVRFRDVGELQPVQKIVSEDRRQKIMSAGRKAMDEYETTFRILAK